MKKYYIYISFILIVIIFAIFLVLRESERPEYSDFYKQFMQEDSIYFENLDISIETGSSYKYTTMVSENLRLSLVPDIPKKGDFPYFSSAYLCFFTEYGKSKINRCFYRFNDKKYFTLPEYNNINGKEYIYRLISTEGSEISEYFFNLPYIRMTDSIFQNNMKKRTDMKKLEEIINSLELDENTKMIIKGGHTPSNIKELLVITQMQLLNLNPTTYYFWNRRNFIRGNVYEINFITIKEFKKIVKDTLHNKGRTIKILYLCIFF